MTSRVWVELVQVGESNNKYELKPNLFIKWADECALRLLVGPVGLLNIETAN